MAERKRNRDKALIQPSVAHRRPDAKTLRHRAEEAAHALAPVDIKALSSETIKDTLHELRVHQIELEMQNEELRLAQAELGSSRTRYLDLYDLAPVGYVTISENGLILEANLTAAALLHTTKGALANQALSRFVLPQDQPVYYQNHKALFETGLGQVCELRMLNKQDTPFWVRLEAVLARDQEAGAGMGHMVMNDITERKRAEETLAASNRQLEESNRRLLDIRQQLETNNQQLRKAEKSLRIRNQIAETFLTVPDQQMYHEILTIILEAMQSPFGIFGYIDDQGALAVPCMIRHNGGKGAVSDTKTVFPRKQWAHSSWARAIREKRSNYSNALSSELPLDHMSIERHISMPLIHRNKAVGLFLVANKPADYTAGDVAFLEEIARATAPVLDARLRRDKFEAERERLLSAIEQAGEMFLITDPDGVIQYVNPAFEHITGYSLDETVGQTPRMLKSGQQDQAQYRRLWETISAGRTWKGRMINQRKDGTIYTEEATISPVRSASGRIVNYVAVKHDITEHLKLADQFQQAQKMESVGRLAGGVAHDLNNMLSVIYGFAELAMAKVDPADALHADLEQIFDAARRSSQITRQLLAFARKQTISPKVIDLNETVEGILKMLRHLIGEDINLLWKPETGLWPVKIDPSQLDQILANLCVNARDAIADVGKIIIETQTVTFDQLYCADHPEFFMGDFVMLAVSDDGCGMDQETLKNIFEPFFTTKAVGQGTGLGLATVYGIVKQNEGCVNVYSEPGNGTTFRIYLPRHKAGSEDAMPVKGAMTPAGRGETVLVVEDDSAILELAQKILQAHGYAVLAAKTPDEAVALAKRQAGQIQLLVTDVVMPGMNGRELAGQVLSLCPGLKTVYMSGYTADIIAHRGVLDESVHFIQKPFSAQELAATIRKVLDA